MTRVIVRPVVMARIGYACAAVVLIAFVATALLQRRDNAGAYFGSSDHIATVLVGVVLAALFLLPAVPRLEADEQSVRVRSFFGGWREVPWDVVVRVEFPRNVRFARLVLPAEEVIVLYAVQRMDKQQAVDTMRQLRELFAATHR